MNNLEILKSLEKICQQRKIWKNFNRYVIILDNYLKNRPISKVEKMNHRDNEPRLYYLDKLAKELEIPVDYNSPLFEGRLDTEREGSFIDNWNCGNFYRRLRSFKKKEVFITHEIIEDMLFLRDSDFDSKYPLKEERLKQRKNILSKVDLTLLNPEATEIEIDNLVKTANDNKVKGVCVHPYFIERVAKKLNKNIELVAVIGFPLGMNTKSVKLTEASEAIESGATEIDMVINFNQVKDEKWEEFSEEVGDINFLCKEKGVILKVIVETSRLTEDEKISVCAILRDLEVGFIKTSTGFSTAGANIADIKLFKRVAPNLKVKASGGIKSIYDFEEMIMAGADRIGASSIASLIGKKEDKSNY